jgi:hypothetical protein
MFLFSAAEARFGRDEMGRQQIGRGRIAALARSPTRFQGEKTHKRCHIRLLEREPHTAICRNCRIRGNYGIGEETRCGNILSAQTQRGCKQQHEALSKQQENKQEKENS